MKLNRIIFAALASLAIASCTDIEDVAPQSGTILQSQLQEVNLVAPQRADASFNGLFAHIGYPDKMYSTPDDWGFIMMGFCNDLEGTDQLMPDSNYNWFSVCGEYSSRNANYRNPYIRYRAPYNLIADVNTFVSSYPSDVTDPKALNYLAQARTLRAYAYLQLAPAFQFVTNKSGACVPIVTEEAIDYTQNPRATVQEVYDLIFKDLNWALENIGDGARKTKMNINKAVIYGLRARANLDMQNYADAAKDAEAAFNAGAAEGLSVASLQDVSKPSFYDINENNWIWGYDMTNAVADRSHYATASSWLRSFSADGYAPATQCYTMINTLLYNKIPATDVRKGWWVDENLSSPLTDNLKWPGIDDVDLAHASDGGDAKLPFLPYTNVKFGCYTLGTTTNDEDFPLMRMEEMILIQVEGLAKSGNEGKAKQMLNDFVKTYRDPAYDCSATGLSFADEIWKQRRIELWGEGFGVYDIKRLGKPLVRFHEGDEDSNMPTAFAFNMKADDGYLLMRFPQGEMNTNFAIVDNTEGDAPVQGQNGGLRDGVTD